MTRTNRPRRYGYSGYGRSFAYEAQGAAGHAGYPVADLGKNIIRRMSAAEGETPERSAVRESGNAPEQSGAQLGLDTDESLQSSAPRRSLVLSADDVLARQEAEFEAIAEEAAATHAVRRPAPEDAGDAPVADVGFESAADDAASSARRKRVSDSERERTRKVEQKHEEAAAAAATTGSSGRVGGRGAHSAAKGEATDYSREAAGKRYSARKSRMSTGKKVGIGVVAVLLVALIAGGVAIASWYGTIAGNLAGDGKITDLPAAVNGEPYYVLLLGGDSREDTKEDNRTDSIMVARIDEKNKGVSLLSVPRDLRVYIDGEGYCKVNSAIEYGGYNQVVDTVNDVLGIQINYYAFIYFSGFKDLVDKLGGVNVDVPEGTTYRGVWVPAGEDVEINGKEALVLARCRHGYPPDTGAYAMGDYQRTLNQRNLIKAIAKKVLAQDASQLPGLVESLSECVETNMGVSQIVSAAQNMKGFDTDSLAAAQLPVAGATIGGEWYAVMYKDVFEVMIDNFREGRSCMKGLSGFDTQMNDNDIGGSYTDAKPFAYTNYANLYGDFTKKSD